VEQGEQVAFVSKSPLAQSLTKVTVNRLLNTIYFQGSNVSLILPRWNRNCLGGVDCQVEIFVLSSNSYL